MTDNVEDIDSEESGESTDITPAGEMSFIIDPKNHSDAKLLRRLNRDTKDALDILMSIARDVEAPTKERRMAAESIVDARNKVSNSINEETFKRMVS